MPRYFENGNGDFGPEAFRAIHCVQLSTRSYIVETDQGAHLRRNRRHLQAIPGRQAQTAVATPTVLSNPEADARTPMTIHPTLWRAVFTFIH